MNKIDEKQLAKMAKQVEDDPVATAMRHALLASSPMGVSKVMESTMATQYKFSIDIPTMSCTNQMASGRCWMFAACNVMRETIAKRYHIDDFELSQSYLAFYDKLEKVNYTMNSCIELIDHPLDDRTLNWVLQTGIQDGGQWDMIVSIVKKYGIVPKYAMPETYTSSHTMELCRLLNAKVRKFNADIRRLHAAHNDKRIEPLRAKVLADVYRFLTDCLGVPPVSFDFEYVDREKKYHCDSNVTPIDFYHDYLQSDLDDYISIINAPTSDKPFGKVFTVKYLGNVADGNPICYLNLAMKDFKQLVVKQLSNHELVWFGCDCGKFNDRDHNIWDDKLFDLSSSFETSFDMTKTEMLENGHSSMNHAMVLCGVNLVRNRPTKWKIENSWGTEHANKGYHVASDSWFDLLVYQAVINKKYLTPAQLEMLKQKPIELNPWDPMGSLAD